MLALPSRTGGDPYISWTLLKPERFLRSGFYFSDSDSLSCQGVSRGSQR